MRRPVAQFALAGLIVLAVFGASAVLALRSLGRDEALRDARQFAVLAGQGIVEPALGPASSTGPQARRRGRPARQERVLSDRVVRVKIWDARRSHRLLGRAAADRVAYPARTPRSCEALRDGRGAGRAQRPRPARRTASSTARASLYEVYLPRPHAGRHAAPLRDVPAPRRGRVDGPADLAPVRGRSCSRASSSSGSSRCPLAWRLAPPPAAEPDRARGAARPRRRGVRRRAAPDRRRPPRRRRPGPRRHLVLAQRRGRARERGRPATRATLRDAAAGDARRDAPASARCSSRSTRRTCGRRARGCARRPRSRRSRRAGSRPSSTIADGLAPRRRTTEQLVYRAAGEALRNVERHAERDAASRSRVGRRTASRGSRSTTTASASRPKCASGAARRATSGSRCSRSWRRGRAADSRCARRRATGRPSRWRCRADDPRSSSPTTTPSSGPGSRSSLATFHDVELVGAAANGEEAVALCAEQRPDVVLMDLEMPVLDGIEATRRIQAAQPDVAVVVLTSFSDRERILRALDAGAVGYLLKDAEPDELARAIRAAARGEAPLDPKAARALLQRAHGGAPRRRALRARARGPRAWSPRASRTS